MNLARFLSVYDTLFRQPSIMYSSASGDNSPPPSLDLSNYEENGYVVVQNLIDINRYIKPLTNDIEQVIRLVLRNHSIEPTPFGFHADYSLLRKVKPSAASAVYDVIKQLRSFHDIIVSDAINDCLKVIFGSNSTVAIAGNGCGIRVDKPLDQEHSTNYHQDYCGQLRSPKGVVVWAPLINMTYSMGPLKILRSSHKLGVLPILTTDKQNPSLRKNATAFNIAREKELLSSFPVDEPLLNLGDVAFIDFLNVHKSGTNISDTDRWTMQLRYFDVHEPIGQKINWAGGISSGVDFKTVHPKMFVSSPESEALSTPLSFNDL